MPILATSEPSGTEYSVGKPDDHIGPFPLWMVNDYHREMQTTQNIMRLLGLAYVGWRIEYLADYYAKANWTLPLACFLWWLDAVGKWLPVIVWYRPLARWGFIERRREFIGGEAKWPHIYWQIFGQLRLGRRVRAWCYRLQAWWWQWDEDGRFIDGY